MIFAIFGACALKIFVFGACVLEIFGGCVFVYCRGRVRVLPSGVSCFCVLPPVVMSDPTDRVCN